MRYFPSIWLGKETSWHSRLSKEVWGSKKRGKNGEEMVAKVTKTTFQAREIDCMVKSCPTQCILDKY
jgi:hypothetical protein